MLHAAHTQRTTFADCRGMSFRAEALADHLLLQRVVSFCTLHDRCRAASASRLLYQACSSLELWRALDLSTSSPLAVTDNVLISMLRQHPTVASLNLAFCCKLSNKTLQAASVLLKATLTELNVENGRQITDAGVVAVAKSCRLLRSLNVNGCVGVTMLGLKRVLHHRKALTRLSLNGLLEVDDKVCPSAPASMNLNRF